MYPEILGGCERSFVELDTDGIPTAGHQIAHRGGLDLRRIPCVNDESTVEPESTTVVRFQREREWFRSRGLQETSPAARVVVAIPIADVGMKVSPIPAASLE